MWPLPESEKPCGIVPREIATLSDIEATSPPPPLEAVVEAIACAVSSYCSRVGGVDEEVQATRRDPKVSQVMRFMAGGRARHGPESPREIVQRGQEDAWLLPRRTCSERGETPQQCRLRLQRKSPVTPAAS